MLLLTQDVHQSMTPIDRNYPNIDYSTSTGVQSGTHVVNTLANDIKNTGNNLATAMTHGSNPIKIATNTVTAVVGGAGKTMADTGGAIVNSSIDNAKNSINTLANVTLPSPAAKEVKKAIGKASDVAHKGTNDDHNCKKITSSDNNHRKRYGKYCR